ncbi:MAG: hypothetical protein MUE65_02155 [Methanomassiliicoccales archaeon]|nr:hypothetical protein [Methanomassiliicoccales archaeon]
MICMFCGSCGSKQEEGYSFCPTCGARLGTAPEPTLPLAPSMSPLPGNLGQAVRLNPGESIVTIYRARSLGDPRKKDEDGGYNSMDGVLLLTDQRLVFIEETGILQKKMIMTESIDLGSINLVDVSGFMSKIVTVHHVRYNLNYITGFDNFRELDMATMKGGRPVDLYQAHRVVSEATARRKGR